MEHEGNHQRGEERQPHFLLISIGCGPIPLTCQPLRKHGDSNKPSGKVEVNQWRDEEHIHLCREEICVFEHAHHRGKANPDNECDGHSVIARNVSLSKQCLENDDAHKHGCCVDGCVFSGITCIAGSACVFRHWIPNNRLESLVPNGFIRKNKSTRHCSNKHKNGPNSDFLIDGVL